MPALYAVGRDLDSGRPSFIVVADNSKAAYILKNKAEEKTRNERIAMLTEIADEKPQAAVDWLALALQNMGHVSVDMPRRARTFNEAVKSARKMWKEGFDVAPPERINALTALAEAHDDWSEDHEDVWSDEDEAQSKPKGDYNVWHPDISASLEDELEFQHTVAGAVIPENPHMWLPPSVGATECAYCGKEQADPIHPPGNTMPGNVIVTEEA